MVQLFIGLFTEGTTDQRFLKSIVEKSFIYIGMECNSDIEIFVQPIKIDKTGLVFSEQTIEASRIGIEKFGISVLCLHSDADDKTDNVAFQKINKAVEELQNKDNLFCKLVTPVVPVQMIEAWLLTDKELLKKQIGTNKSDIELQINRNPELIADPKTIIENAIRIAREGLSKRRRKDLTIGELYLPIGQKIEIEKLNTLPSFRKFIAAVRKTYRDLNYLT